MNEAAAASGAIFGISNGTVIGLSTQADDAIVAKMKLLSYNVPRGCVGAYYPKCNLLIQLSHRAEESKVPAGKSVPVRIIR